MKEMDWANPGGLPPSIYIPTCITRCEKGFYKPGSLSKMGAVNILKIIDSQNSKGRSA